MSDIQTTIEKCKELRKKIKQEQNYKEIKSNSQNQLSLSFMLLISLFPIGIPVSISLFQNEISIVSIGVGLLIAGFLGSTIFSWKKYFFYQKKYNQIEKNIEESIKNFILSKEQLLVNELLSYDNLYKKKFYKKYKKEENYKELLGYLKESIKKVKKLEKKEMKDSNNNLQNTELEKEFNYQEAT